MKDRAKNQSEEEKEWYEKAFGRKRNMMKFTIVYKSLNEMVKKGKYEFYAKVKYNMFPEMMEEFNPHHFP